MDLEAHRNLQALEAIAEDDRITQRTLSTKLGIALGLTNIYLKRLVRKGYVKCVNVQSNRLRYLLTPTGIAEKTRLTYEFMAYSLVLYRRVREHLRIVLAPLAGSGKRVAIYGAGEAAELAYISLREAGFQPAAIFGDDAPGRFLGEAIRDIREQGDVPFDLLIVATLEPPAALVSQLIAAGVTAEKLITLQPHTP
jgi:DNA-binding MarR family transcriptional regulator